MKDRGKKLEENPATALERPEPSGFRRVHMPQADSAMRTIAGECVNLSREPLPAALVNTIRWPLVK